MGTKTKTPKAVYVVTNDEFLVKPDSKTQLYKIGIAQNIKKRWNLDEMGCGRVTDCPGEFRLVAAVIMDDRETAENIEKMGLHKIFDPIRIVCASGKHFEWFAMTEKQLEGLQTLLSHMGQPFTDKDMNKFTEDLGIQMPDDGETTQLGKRAKWTLAKLGIKKGTKLFPRSAKFTKKYVVVTDNNKVLLNGTGQPMSISSAARAIGGYIVSGFVFFCGPDGERTLSEMVDEKIKKAQELAENAE
ncbi:MAG: GIY-YIG nuclease family protein [Muribaculaceae bacterium]|nr:GIY-YIG nuclease family protein [Muribaculaceae bacterium]